MEEENLNEVSESIFKNLDVWKNFDKEAFALMYRVYKAGFEAGKFDKAGLSDRLNTEDVPFVQKGGKEMSYLADIKIQVQKVFDDAFKEAWPVIEKAIKESYHNGRNAANSNPPNRRQP